MAAMRPLAVTDIGSESVELVGMVDPAQVKPSQVKETLG